MITFAKYHGLGNDFIIIDDMAACLSLKPQQIESMCRIHFGIGADGLILARPSAIADLEMIFFNNDGTRVEMCGNGIRCLARFAIDNSILSQDRITIETLAGIKTVEISTDDEADQVTVDMGTPDFAAGNVPVVSAKPEFINEPIDAEGRILSGTAVSMGNPHIVFFITSLDSIDLDKLGPFIEHLEIFPKKVNVEFAVVEDRQNVSVRVWERGVGETLACGTGACAVLAAGVKNGLLDRRAAVKLPGGVLKIDWQDSGTIMMSGPAIRVFTGEIDINKL